MRISEWCGTLSGLLLVPFAASQAVTQTGLTLVTGQLSFSGRYVTQAVSVKNTSANTVQIIKIDCEFFRQDQLIATGSAYISNVVSLSAGSTDVIARTMPPQIVLNAGW